MGFFSFSFSFSFFFSFFPFSFANLLRKVLTSTSYRNMRGQGQNEMKRGSVSEKFACRIIARRIGGGGGPKQEKIDKISDTNCMYLLCGYES